MSQLFSDVYSVLSDYGVRKPEHVTRLRRKPGKAGHESAAIRKELYAALEGVYSSLDSKLGQVRGTALCVDASGERRLSDMIVRKCLLFGSVSVILVKGARAIQGPTPKNASFSVDHDHVIPSGLVEALIRYRPLVESGLIVVLPESLKSIAWSQRSGEINALAHALPVNLQNDALFCQLSESTAEDQPRAVGYANILLPSLARWRPEDIVIVRQELPDEFHRFHRQLRKMLGESSSIGSGDGLLSLMEATDHEVRILHSQVNRLHRTRIIKGTSMVAGVVAASLCAFAPGSLGATFGSVFGGASVTSGLAFITDMYGSYTDLHNNDFYFPWYLGFGKRK